MLCFWLLFLAIFFLQKARIIALTLTTKTLFFTKIRDQIFFNISPPSKNEYLKKNVDYITLPQVLLRRSAKFRIVDVLAIWVFRKPFFKLLLLIPCFSFCYYVFIISIVTIYKQSKKNFTYYDILSVLYLSVSICSLFV